MKTPKQIIKEFAEMGDRYTLSLKDDIYYEGYIFTVESDYFTFWLGGPLAPKDPITIKYSDLDFNSLCFHDPMEKKYKCARWCEEEKRWIIKDHVRSKQLVIRKRIFQANKYRIISLALLGILLLLFLFAFLDKKVFPHYRQGKVVQTRGTKALTQSDLEVSGIRLYAFLNTYSGMLPEQVKEEEQQRDGEGVIYSYFYPDFTLKCHYYGEETQARIISIVITSGKIKTTRGISIEDSENEVYKRYGRTEKYGNIINYDMQSGYDGLNFKIVQGKVAEIEIYYGYNPSGLNNLGDEDMELAGLRLLTPLEDYTGSLPPEVKPKEIDGYWCRFYYPGFTIVCRDERGEGENTPRYVIYRIIVSGKNIETPRGISVGDSAKTVLGKYGIVRMYSSIDYQTYWDNRYIGINFSLTDGKVSEIELYYDIILN